VNSPQGNAFVSASNVLGSEQFRDYEMDRRWVVQSTTKVNALGQPTAYELRPIDTVVPYSDPSFPPLQRAAFAQHALWVSRYREGELYATGDYPNQNAPGEGLPGTSANTKMSTDRTWSSGIRPDSPTCRRSKSIR
jgi:primary-amine oxidase